MRDATTVREVDSALRRELRTVLGHRVSVHLGRRTHLMSAKEAALGAVHGALQQRDTRLYAVWSLPLPKKATLGVAHWMGVLTLNSRQLKAERRLEVPLDVSHRARVPGAPPGVVFGWAGAVFHEVAHLGLRRIGRQGYRLASNVFNSLGSHKVMAEVSPRAGVNASEMYAEIARKYIVLGEDAGDVVTSVHKAVRDLRGSPAVDTSRELRAAFRDLGEHTRADGMPVSAGPMSRAPRADRNVATLSLFLPVWGPVSDMIPRTTDAVEQKRSAGQGRAEPAPPRPEPRRRRFLGLGRERGKDA